MENTDLKTFWQGYFFGVFSDVKQYEPKPFGKITASIRDKQRREYAKIIKEHIQKRRALLLDSAR